MSTESNNTDIQRLQEALRLGLAVVTEWWSYATEDWVSSVHASDIDGDGDIEVLTGSRDGSVRVLTKRGGLKWKFERSGEWIGTVFGIDNTEAVDKTRVVVGSRNNKVYALDEAGQLLWEYETDQVVRQVRVKDIDQDGKAEVIVGSEDRAIHVLECETGRRLWKYDTSGWIRSVFAIDIDGDGEIETLAASGDRHLYALDSRGQLKWKHDTKSKVHALFAADLNRDGVVEILVGSDTKDLYALTPDLQKMWQFFPENRIHSIFVADLNNDGRLEVIAGSEDKHIYFLDEQGNLLWKHHLGFRVFSLYAIDLDRDGQLEILAGTEDNSIHVLRVELTDGLLAKILTCHKALGQPKSTTLDLSLTECALLQDLTDESLLHRQDLTVAEVEQTLKDGDYLRALSGLLVLDQQRTQLLWRKHLGSVRSVCFGDISAHPGLEVVAGTEEGSIYVLDVSGAVHWSRSLGGRVFSVQVGDVDRDGVVEVVAGSANGQVCALDTTGEAIKWRSQLDEWIKSIHIAELETQGSIGMVMGSAEKRIHIYGERLLPIIEPIVTPQGIQIVCTHDLNGDGRAEIIAGAVDDNVYVYTREGVLLWLYKTGDRVKALGVKDIDADSRMEIIVGSEDGNVHVLDSNGHLKWRYSTPHRVLDVDAADLDQDGNVEVLIGVGDGHVYVLSGAGDLLWKYTANDRVRVVRAADLNGDGIIEITVASEDCLYLLQMLDRQWIQQQIIQCWDVLRRNLPAKELIYELARHPDAALRAFALTRLVEQTDLVDGDFDLCQQLLNDSSQDVRKTFAHAVVALYKANPNRSRRFLDLLAADREPEVRLAFVDSLPALTAIDWRVGFEYLDRFTRSVDRWVKRAVVRKLYPLAAPYHQQVFRLLLSTVQDQSQWVRQESARTLAHYLAIHSENLIVGAHSLIVKGVDLSVLDLIVHAAAKSIVRDVFRVLLHLLSDLDEANIVDRLREAVQAFEKTRSLKFGEETWKVHHELYRLHTMQTIDEMARYKCALDHAQLAEVAHFAGTLRILEQLTDVAMILATYLKREGLGDRLASLLEAITAIETVYTNLGREPFQLNTQKPRYPDHLIFEILLKKWRAIVAAELRRLRGKADLRPELQTKLVWLEEKVGVWLDIRNEGRSPADNVQVTLKQSDDFEVIGARSLTFETVPAQGAVLAEFTIRPRTTSPHLTFELIYDDAEAKEKVLLFGDRVELLLSKQEFRHIQNPYTCGTPVQNKDMFYGHEEDLMALKETLSFTSGNMIVVLYGQRRSGKSSLLYQLLNTTILEPHVPVYIDMQGESLGISTSRFLRNMAFAIFRYLRMRKITVDRPSSKDFDEDATFAFDLFLDDVEIVLKDRKLVILIDEFEILEQKVTEKALDREIFEYLRSLMQHRRGLNFLLSGTHTIEQLTAGYWSVFFNIALHYRLSKLSEQAAIQLISEPVMGALEYDGFAIEKIRGLTADQPYLIQLICRSLVEHCNSVQKNYVTISDVNIVLDTVMETGQAHFKWVWGQATLEERLVLSVVAQEGGDEGRLLSLADIEEAYRHYGLPYDHERILRALQNLIEGDIIEDASEGTRFRVPVGLTRRWLREAKSLRRVMLEENLLA